MVDPCFHVPFTSMHFQYLNRIGTQLVHVSTVVMHREVVPCMGVGSSEVTPTSVIPAARTNMHLPTWWTNWTLAREWNDVCSFSNDPFRHYSANNSHEHSVLYKRVRYVYDTYTVSGFCYARVLYWHSAVKTTRKLHNVFYSLQYEPYCSLSAY